MRQLRTRASASLTAGVLALGPLGCSADDPASDDAAGATDATTTEATTTGDAASTTGAVDTTAVDSTGIATGSSTGEPGLPCNGHVQLCDRPFDEIAFPGTHNSHAALDDGFVVVNANHQHGIATQLADGARVLLIDVYPDETDPGVVLMCHGSCALASTPHLDGLGAIGDFLVANPREVVTIIYQDEVAVGEIVEDFATTGADARVFTHTPGTPWPTLGEMIEADTRLVVTLESGGPPPGWMHHVWDEAWDTPYGPTQIEDLSCDLNRGSPDNDLFLVNHWVNNEVGLPSAENADIVNAADVLGPRVQACRRQWDHIPNFVVVDFYERGDLFAVVDDLNGL